MAEDLSEVKCAEISLKKLRTSSAEVLDFEPKERTIRGALREVLEYLEGRKVELEYVCGKCRAPIDGEMRKCWACGSVIEDDEDFEMEAREVKRRAEKLGIKTEGVEAEDLKRLVEEKETIRRKMGKDVSISNLESERLNEILTSEMGNGWRKTRAIHYVSYWDPDNVRRIAVYFRGLNVHFSVDEELLDGFEGVTYYDQEERKRSHMGRTNYIYDGDISKDALEICRLVLRRYSG